MNNTPITELQALPENLTILKAVVVKYNYAKKIRQFRILLSYLLVLGAPFLVIASPALKVIAGIIGGSWSVIAFILANVEKDITKSGAKLQEEFDLALFRLERNKIAIGDQISTETIHNLAGRFKGNMDESWYGNTKSIPYPFDVLVCQRSNIVWDWRLRKNYVQFGAVLLVLLFGIGIIFSLQAELMLADYIKIIFLPSSSAYILGFKELNEHYDNYVAKQKLESKVNRILDICFLKNEAPDRTVLRQIQDVIFTLRKCTAIIPNWFAGWHKKKYEQRMQVVLDKYKTRFS